MLDHALPDLHSNANAAVRDPEEARVRHIADSLALLPVLDRHIQQMQAHPGGKTPVLQPRSSAALSKANAAQDSRAASSQTGDRASSSVADSSRGGRSGASPGSTPLRLIDVGTGPGLPGMVLAIARPHWQVTLLDSLRKRCDFMTKAAQTAGE
jgi:16S rRNA G527 N7-methylase RsmG